MKAKTLPMLSLLLLVLLSPLDALVHRLKINNDDRNIFKIETFGFVGGGMMNFTLSDFSIHSPSPSPKVSPLLSQYHSVNITASYLLFRNRSVREVMISMIVLLFQVHPSSVFG